MYSRVMYPWLSRILIRFLPYELHYDVPNQLLSLLTIYAWKILLWGLI